MRRHPIAITLQQPGERGKPAPQCMHVAVPFIDEDTRSRPEFVFGVGHLRVKRRIGNLTGHGRYRARGRDFLRRLTGCCRLVVNPEQFRQFGAEGFVDREIGSRVGFEVLDQLFVVLAGLVGVSRAGQQQGQIPPPGAV